MQGSWFSTSLLNSFRKCGQTTRKTIWPEINLHCVNEVLTSKEASIKHAKNNIHFNTTSQLIEINKTLSPVADTCLSYPLPYIGIGRKPKKKQNKTKHGDGKVCPRPG